MLSHRIKKLLRVPPDRQVRTGLLFLFSFGMTGAYVGARSDADAVFLSRIGIERLPAMILVSASGVAIVTALYARILARLSLRRVIFTTHLLLAMVTLALAFMLKTDDRTIGIPAALYLLAELRGALGSIQFATLLNELFRSEAPARVSGVASSGSTLAGRVAHLSSRKSTSKQPATTSKRKRSAFHRLAFRGTPARATASAE